MGCRPGRHASSKFRIFPRKLQKSKSKFSDISLFNKGFQKEEAEFNKFSTTTKTYNHGHHHEMITLRLSTDGSTLQIEKKDDNSCTSECSSRIEFSGENIEHDNVSICSYSSKCKSEPLLSKKSSHMKKNVYSDCDMSGRHSSVDPSSEDECEWYTAEIYHSGNSSSTTTATIHCEDNSTKILLSGSQSDIMERTEDSTARSEKDKKFQDVTLTPNLSKLSAEYITHLSEQILANASTHLALHRNHLKEYNKQVPATPKKKKKDPKQFLKLSKTKKYFARFSESGDISFFSSDELNNINTKI